MVAPLNTVSRWYLSSWRNVRLGCQRFHQTQASGKETHFGFQTVTEEEKGERGTERASVIAECIHCTSIHVMGMPALYPVQTLHLSGVYTAHMSTLLYCRNFRMACHHIGLLWLATIISLLVCQPQVEVQVVA